MTRANLTAVVIGGTLEAIDGQPPRCPPSFHLSQVSGLGCWLLLPACLQLPSACSLFHPLLLAACCLLPATPAPSPPPTPPLLPPQADAFGRLLPREFVPAELLNREALHEAAREQALQAAGPAAAALAPATAAGGAAAAAAAAAAEGPLDCLEACCLHDDLHLFRWVLLSRTGGQTQHVGPHQTHRAAQHCR
jgi:hypothetical protein